VSRRSDDLETGATGALRSLVNTAIMTIRSYRRQCRRRHEDSAAKLAAAITSIERIQSAEPEARAANHRTVSPRRLNLSAIMRLSGVTKELSVELTAESCPPRNYATP
jgi:hypothetical protein